jgi:hypothetical protein
MTLAPATPETAALTCPHRRNTYLPGTTHKRLQITADMHGSGNLGLHPLKRTERGDM